ncbi:MAG TPA: glutathione binding-like protein [Rhodanobacteraceae bacterium]|nr:glutathione binding-like protein [Rhodanobacteraceae bacterium]
MKLYYKPGACSLSDHIALEWVGEDYEAINATDSLKSPEYLKLNHLGKVPTLEIGDWTLTENVAILNYLADIHPESGLGGDGTPRSRAEINRWLAFVNSDVHPAFHPLFGMRDYLGDPAMVEKTKAEARRKLRGYFELADAQLQQHEYIAGDTRSIADPYLFVVLRWAHATKVDLDGLDALASYFERLRADEGVQRAMRAEGLGTH